MSREERDRVVVFHSASPKLKERDLNTRGSLQWNHVQEQKTGSVRTLLCGRSGQPLDLLAKKQTLLIR